MQVPPGNWIAPPGSNRSSRGGNETAEASDVTDRFWRPSEQAGPNASEHRAGPETVNAGADPPSVEGRPMSRGKAAQRRERSIPIDPAGVVVRACTQSENRRNTGSPGGGGVCAPTGRPRGHRPGRVGVAERLVIVMKRGNARGAKEPWFWSACRRNNGRAIGFMPRTSLTTRRSGSSFTVGRRCLPGNVCPVVNPVREPDAGNPHVRFDEREVETEHG